MKQKHFLLTALLRRIRLLCLDEDCSDEGSESGWHCLFLTKGKSVRYALISKVVSFTSHQYCGECSRVIYAETSVLINPTFGSSFVFRIITVLSNFSSRKREHLSMVACLLIRHVSVLPLYPVAKEERADYRHTPCSQIRLMQ